MTATVETDSSVRSADGTMIAFERSGAGPALIVVDAAGCYRDFRPLRAPVERLAADFTVYAHDRRGRGASTDTLPYAVAREVDDLAALITEAGGSAFVYAMSSGSLLALHAAGGLAIRKLALFEPPIEPNEAPRGETGFTSEFAGLVAAGRRRDAGGILPPRDRRAGGGHGADDPAGLGGAGGGRAHPRLRLQDLRRDVASAHQVGDGTHPRDRQPGQRRRADRHGRHGGRGAAPGQPPQPGRWLAWGPRRGAGTGADRVPSAQKLLHPHAGGRAVP
jgi:Alpha/beta hydrolase family